MYLSDDDFADSTPPMPKKPKLSNKENKEKKDKSLSKTQNKAKERKYVCCTFYVIVLARLIY